MAHGFPREASSRRMRRMTRARIGAALLLFACLAAAPAAGAPPARRPAAGKPPATKPPAASPAPAAEVPEIPIAQEDGFERSVVRIINYSQRGDWFSPWDV